MKKRQFVIHPYLFALYPVVALLASNLDQISPVVGLRAAIILVSGTAVLVLLFWLWMKDIKKAGLAVSWILFLLFSFKYIIILLENIQKDNNAIIATLLLLVVFCTLILVGPWLIWRFVKSSPDMLTTFLNVVAVVIVIFPLFQIGRYLLISPVIVEKLNSGDTLDVQTSNANNDLPDVYYIIVDGYGRSDILQEMYDYDNSDFLDSLTDRGFYVANQSSANYMQTYLSLASSLNFDYLDTLAQTLGNDLNRRDPLTYLIQQNQVRKIFEEAGYETVIYDSNWPIIDSYKGVTSTAFGQTPGKNTAALGLNSFESLLWENTIFTFFTPNNLSYDGHRNLILENLEGIKSVAPREGPQFVIGHIIAPHPPFVFDAEGNSIQPDYAYSINDGNAFEGTPEQYLTGYANQVTHINKLLLNTVDHILAESDQPPIIIIQGDHGPGSTLDFDVLENNTCFKERMAILNAYYFPDGEYDALYENITPVNSFRVVFNKLFDSNIELVPDKNYFSLWNAPYDFVEVTDELTSCKIAEN